MRDREAKGGADPQPSNETGPLNIKNRPGVEPEVGPGFPEKVPEQKAQSDSIKAEELRRKPADRPPLGSREGEVHKETDAVIGGRASHARISTAPTTARKGEPDLAPIRPCRVFVSYAHPDERHRKRLEKHLSALRRDGLIRDWNDRQIVAGADWAEEIDTTLDDADIILLLVSADFLDSDYCYTIEMPRAVERHEVGRVHVIPVIVRACDWQRTPFAKLQALPTEGKPVTDWSNRDKAWFDVVRGIRSVITRLNEGAQT